MKVLTFSQATGFVEIDAPVPIEDMESEEHWLKRCGCSCNDPMDTDTGTKGEYDVLTLRVSRPIEAMRGWQYVVIVVDPFLPLYVLVMDSADLMDLRLRLAPLVLMSNVRELARVSDIACKAFAVWHGHAHYEECPSCDPMCDEAAR